MTHENELITTGAEKTEHHTWLGNIIEAIEETIDNIDVDIDFPLSGGDESHKPHIFSTPKSSEEIDQEEKEEKHKRISFLNHINADFPLSGG